MCDARDLLPCECHGDDLVPYCPRHTPLPGGSEQRNDSGAERPIERLLRATQLLRGERTAELRAEARAEYEQLRASLSECQERLNHADDATPWRPL